MGYHPESLILELEKTACLLRSDSLKMITRRQAGHPGGSLSAADIITALYFHHLKLDVSCADWAERDRFILSKGHASALLYSALARRGFFAYQELEYWGELTCPLQGHPDRLKTPGVDMNSGILGHGVAIGAGMAYANLKQNINSRVYVLIGDGECQAGIVWEGAMLAAKFRLDHLTVILDYNNVQLDGMVHDIMPLDSIVAKWESFNWAVLEINGHDMRQIVEALDMAAEIHHQPAIIIAHTTKGKGVSFMENQSFWHGNVPSPEQLQLALAEVEWEG